MNVLALLVLCVPCRASVSCAQSRRVSPTPTRRRRLKTTVRVHTEEIKLNVLAFDEKRQFLQAMSPRTIS